MNEVKRRSYNSDEDYPHQSTATGTNNVHNTELETPHSEKGMESPSIKPKKSSIKIKKQYSKIYRLKTKILQNFGKADKTTDDIFCDYEANFNKQQLNANRLLKEVSNYVRCARALHGASKALYDCLSEVYEPEWVGHDLVYSQAQNSDMLWTDFCHKIQDQTLAPLTAYAQEFPDIKKKIDKRGRKLVDYDSQRHQLEGLQRSTRRDEYKIARGRDQLDTALKTYQSLNKELYDVLPSIYDQRIPQTSNCLRSLFAAESTFMQEASKISLELEAIADKLGREGCKGTYNSKRGVPPKDPKILSITSSNTCSEVQGEASKQNDEENAHSDNSINEELPKGKEGSYSLYPKIEAKAPLQTTTIEEPKSVELQAADDNLHEVSLTNGDAKINGQGPDASTELKAESKHSEDDNNPFLSADSRSESPESPPSLPTLPPPYSENPPAVSTEAANTDASAVQEPNSNRPTISSPITHGKEETGRPYEEINFEDKVNGTRNTTNGDISTSIPAGARTENLPPGVLYKVKAAYKYQQEDVDEVSFEIGEVLQVVEYDDPEEQEEGWLCGVKESTNEKGLFPANFTRPI